MITLPYLAGEARAVFRQHDARHVFLSRPASEDDQQNFGARGRRANIVTSGPSSWKHGKHYDRINVVRNPCIGSEKCELDAIVFYLLQDNTTS